MVRKSVSVLTILMYFFVTSPIGGFVNAHLNEQSTLATLIDKQISIPDRFFKLKKEMMEMNFAATAQLKAVLNPPANGKSNESKDVDKTIERVSPKDIEDALTAEADKFYEEKSKKEAPIFGEIYYSMKNFGQAYNAIK